MDTEDDASEHSDDVIVLEKNPLHALRERHLEIESLRVVNTPSGAVFVGIIDILTPWGNKKRLEHFFTSRMCCERDVSWSKTDDATREGFAIHAGSGVSAIGIEVVGVEA